MPEISIVTTTYRNYEKLEKCLSSVIERTKFVDYKWYVWANDPDDKIKSVIHNSMFVDDIQFTDKIEPIFNDNNDGSFSSNNNSCVKETDSKYVLFLNDDVVPLCDNWLLSMKNILDADEKVGVVGSLLLYPDQKTIQHCGVFFSSKTNNLPYHMFYRESASKVSDFISVPRYYQAVTGACMLMRRGDFDSVGGFDEQFYYMYEDISLCLNVKNNLKKYSVFCPSSVLIHNEGISGSKTNPMTKQNIDLFRSKFSGTYMNDLEFYLNSKDYMRYKIKNS